MNYKIKYLPLFYQDLQDSLEYIAVMLGNKPAAQKLFDDVMNAIQSRKDHPESYPIYQTSTQTEYPYYRINIRNYSVFYVVIGDVIEIRRFIYKHRDIDHLLH